MAARDPQQQIALFRAATGALGGQHAAARRLGVSERTIRKLLTGERALHDGFLRDMARGLIEHAERCRWLEREISPAFSTNLTPAQAERMGKRDKRRFDQKATGNKNG